MRLELTIHTESLDELNEVVRLLRSRGHQVAADGTNGAMVDALVRALTDRPLRDLDRNIIKALQELADSQQLSVRDLVSVCAASTGEVQATMKSLGRRISRHAPPADGYPRYLGNLFHVGYDAAGAARYSLTTAGREAANKVL